MGIEMEDMSGRQERTEHSRHAMSEHERHRYEHLHASRGRFAGGDEGGAYRWASESLTAGGFLALVWLAAATALRVVVVWRASTNQSYINSLKSLQATVNDLQCQSYDEATGVLTLLRNGIKFQEQASNDIQFLDGYKTSCYTCPAVAGQAFDLAVNPDCLDINDGFDIGNAGLIARRAKNIGCGTDTTFDVDVSASVAGGNTISTSSNSFGANLNAAVSSSSRCEPLDSEVTIDGLTQHFDLAEQRTSFRNSYFTENDSSNSILCFCQPCGGVPQSVVNTAGAGAKCSSMNPFFPAGSVTLSGTTEIGVYAPSGNWGPLP